MPYKQVLAPIKQRLAQGELEAAYEQLVRWLEQSPAHSELANIARINQAELYQVKAEVLKGTLSNEEARRTYNQLTDKALQIVQLIESGKTTFSTTRETSGKRAWRYYFIGGAVALLAAAIGTWLYFSAAEECPAFGKETQVRVLILPFMGAADKQYNPAIDIMDELNDWIERSPQLRTEAIAVVHKHFDIENNYPNSAEAVALARKCGAHMLVWGKVRQRPDGSLALDVRYRLVDGLRGHVPASASGTDSLVQRLLAATEEAALTSEPPVVARMLYIALSNYRRVPVLAAALKALEEDLAALGTDKSQTAPADTTTSLLLAEHYILSNQIEKAIAEYDRVLAHYPDNHTAHLKRGALYLQMANYEAAAIDLEAVPHADTTLLPALRQARIEAFLRSSQPEKARRELEQAQREGALPVEQVEDKARQVRDSIAAIELRRDQLERKAARTNDPKARVGAARANLALGNADRAAQLATEALKSNPRDTQAVKVAVEAQLRKGDTAEALRIIEQSVRRGATVKGIRPNWYPLLQKDSPQRRQ